MTVGGIDVGGASVGRAALGRREEQKPPWKGLLYCHDNVEIYGQEPTEGEGDVGEERGVDVALARHYATMALGGI